MKLAAISIGKASIFLQDSIAIIAGCKSVTFLSGPSHTEIIIINRENPFEIEPLNLDSTWNGLTQLYLYNNTNIWDLLFLFGIELRVRR